MKRLTQGVFKDAPDWVKSAAVDSNGEAHFYRHKKRHLSPEHSVPPIYDYWYLKAGSSWALSIGFMSQLIGDGFDATDWKRSAINRA